jgi:hypothetical protein
MLSPQSEKNPPKGNNFEESKLIYAQRVLESAKVEKINVDMDDNKARLR